MNKQSLKIAVVAVAVLCVVAALSVRYLSDGIGCPGKGWDCGSHLAVINALARGDLFPYVQSSGLEAGEKGLLYSGILGSHLIALAIAQLGTGLPRAMQMTLDLALLASLVVFWRFLSWSLNRQASLAWALFLALFVPGFCYISSEGFFSLAVSVPFVMLAILLVLQRSLWSGLLAALVSFVVYPDSAFWLLPFLCCVTFRSGASRPLTWLSAAATAIVLPLFSIFLAAELPKDGAIYLNAASFLLIPVLFLVAVTPAQRPWALRLRELPDQALLLLFGFIGMSCWSLVSYVSWGTLKYYALKQYFWAPVLCCFCIPWLLKSGRTRAIVALLLALSPVWLLSPSALVFMGSYSKSRTAFSASDERRVLSVTASPPCPDFIIVGDRAGRMYNNGATFFLSANSYSASLYPSSTVVRLKSGASFDFVRLLQLYWSHAGAAPRALQAPNGTQVCIVDLDQPQSEREPVS